MKLSLIKTDRISQTKNKSSHFPLNSNQTETFQLIEAKKQELKWELQTFVSADQTDSDPPQTAPLWIFSSVGAGNGPQHKSVRRVSGLVSKVQIYGAAAAFYAARLKSSRGGHLTGNGRFTGVRLEFQFPP